MAPSNPPNRDRDLLDSAIPIDSLDSDGPAELGPGDVDMTPIEISDADLDQDEMGGSKIHVFGMAERRNTERWTRKTTANGTGATHCKTFVAKLRLDAIDHLDEQVNDWLEAHPECEVKFVSTSVGKLVGKITEDAIFMNIWV